MLYSQLCNEHSDKSNQWSLGLSLSDTWSAVGAIISSLSSQTLCIAVNLSRWRPQTGSNFSFAHNIHCVRMSTISDSVWLWCFFATIMKCDINMNSGMNNNSGIQFADQENTIIDSNIVEIQPHVTK